MVNPQIESGFDELECTLQDVQNYGVIQTFRFIQREKSKTDSNAKISSVYELKTKILKKNYTVSGIVSSTLPTSHT